MTSLARYVLIDKPIAVGITGAWMKGPAISYEDLNAGTGGIERIPAGTLFAAPSKQGAGGSATPSGPYAVRAATREPSVAAKTVAAMWFGKYRGRPMSEVQETDPRYFDWATQEVNGFEKAARQAGLLEN